MIHTSMTIPTVVAELVRMDGWSSIFHLDGFGRLYSFCPYTGAPFYWAEKIQGGREQIGNLGVGDFALVPEQETDGYFLSFVTFWVEDDRRIMIDEVYASKDSEVEYINGWEFICCYNRPNTLWNYNTAKKYRDEGGQNSELTAADDIIYADVLKREVYAEAKDTNVKNT
ncbi:hypothetical protein EYR41_011920 [Orbilia oligospora]|uniref:Uncharacterized protein n=1 Tax=Orbilia oligospora TaxID=2813651 RepID=A0A7C8KBQ6_ORBOL|nr:hypothetical protein TWF751_008211 [Orbilia oligospora]TGJ62733.1 hypothetical protein EYR41_011920 [Orbilia oligospora]